MSTQPQVIFKKLGLSTLNLAVSARLAIRRLNKLASLDLILSTTELTGSLM